MYIFKIFYHLFIIKTVGDTHFHQNYIDRYFCQIPYPPKIKKLFLYYYCLNYTTNFSHKRTMPKIVTHDILITPIWFNHFKAH